VAENDKRAVTADDPAVDHAVEAARRLRNKAGRAGGAYADGRRQTVQSIADGTLRPTPTEAGKEIGRAYVDAHERATLVAIELREHLAAATTTSWIKSLARTQAAIEREAATACFSLARGLLT
jgi:hypothetical protein